jgi:hypothetical protein
VGLVAGEGLRTRAKPSFNVSIHFGWVMRRWSSRELWDSWQAMVFGPEVFVNASISVGDEAVVVARTVELVAGDGLRT